MSFLPNKNFEKELSEEPEFRQALVDRAEVVADRARDFVEDDSGEYDRRLVVTNRAGEPVRVVAFAPYAHILEWGSRFVGPQAPLRRAVRAVGLRLEELTR